jgi:small-conductance mechanosensitive channel
MDILVPNENLMTSDITNWSYEGDRRIRLRLPVQTGYDDDPQQVIARLERIAREHDRVLKDPAPAAVLIGFGDNGVNLELLVWIENPERGADVRSGLFQHIWKDFKTAGISLPFPQRDVYIKEFPGSAISPADARSGSRAKSARGQKRAAKANPPD